MLNTPDIKTIVTDMLKAVAVANCEAVGIETVREIHPYSENLTLVEMRAMAERANAYAFGEYAANLQETPDSSFVLGKWQTANQYRNKERKKLAKLFRI